VIPIGCWIGLIYRHALADICEANIARKDLVASKAKSLERGIYLSVAFVVIFGLLQLMTSLLKG
jgi:ABC-type uncharacterized transport system permease subunit